MAAMHCAKRDSDRRQPHARNDRVIHGWKRVAVAIAVDEVRALHVQSSMVRRKKESGTTHIDHMKACTNMSRWADHVDGRAQ